MECSNRRNRLAGASISHVRTKRGQISSMMGEGFSTLLHQLRPCVFRLPRFVTAFIRAALLRLVLGVSSFLSPGHSLCPLRVDVDTDGSCAHRMLSDSRQSYEVQRGQSARNLDAGFCSACKRLCCRTGLNLRSQSRGGLCGGLTVISDRWNMMSCVSLPGLYCRSTAGLRATLAQTLARLACLSSDRPPRATQCP